MSQSRFERSLKVKTEGDFRSEFLLRHIRHYGNEYVPQNELRLIVSLVVSSFRVIITSMRYILLILVMFSLAFAPAIASETCETGMEMTASNHSAISLISSDMECCGMPGHESGEMPDDCATQCAIACISILTGISSPSGAYEFEAASLLLGVSASSAWLTHNLAFEPPPPRI